MTENCTVEVTGLQLTCSPKYHVVLRRIKVTFIDTIVRVEHTPESSDTGIALEVHIKRLDYCDEAVKDSGGREPIPVDVHQPPAFVHKLFQFSGVTLQCEELCDQGGYSQPSPPRAEVRPYPDPRPHSPLSPLLDSLSATGP
uniref:Autophagy-related protein 2 homolog A-like n=1 Tax=Callorhinchus milii TaxID=7868 RepID=A0A4W3GXY4_CALMI